MKPEDFTLDHWDGKQYSRLVKYLQQESEEEYRQFQEKLIPGAERILGVRMPKLRTLGKRIAQGNWRGFLDVCQDKSFEETVLCGAVIGAAPVSLQELCKMSDEYVQHIDNWATCDYFCSGLRRLKKWDRDFLPNVHKYLASDQPWIRRAGLVLLRGYYVKAEYIGDIFQWAEQTVCEHYYVQMAHAWLLAECYTKFPKETAAYLEECELLDSIINKTVQKIRDSYRVDPVWKERANAFQRKK